MVRTSYCDREAQQSALFKSSIHFIRVSPQRLIGVEDTEKILDTEQRDGDKLEASNTEGCMEVKRNQIITEVSGQGESKP